MTGFGISQIFSLLLALTGFGVDANPKAPAPDVVLAHAVDDADLVMAVDVAAVAPRNMKALMDLPQHPMIKGNPDLAKMVKQVVTEATGARQMVKGMVGIDVVTDISSFVVYIRANPGHDPDGFVEVRGTLPADLIAKISKLTGAPVEMIDGRGGIAMDTKAYLGIAADGALLVGTPGLVKPRLANTWKAPARPAGSSLARIATLLAEKPFVTVALHPSAGMIADATAKGGDNFGVDLLKDADFLGAALRSDGITWSHVMKSKAGFERVGMMMEGVIELMRAAQIAPRGLAKIVVASLDSYAGKNRDLDDLIKHKADILKVVDAFSGDGQFKVAFDRDAKARSVVVHATGKSLSEVLPGVIVPLGMVGALVFSGSRMKAPAQAYPSQAQTGVAVPPKPVKPVKPVKQPMAPAPHPAH
ncbi:MAG: hypothetical protein K8W52_42245 [Deltaproteobacteria bacterium]|nr:hypothetical protein [Deltaproteobacteria bacterium]